MRTISDLHRQLATAMNTRNSLMIDDLIEAVEQWAQTEDERSAQIAMLHAAQELIDRVG